MNPSQFDHLTKTLTSNTSRRRAIKGLAAAVVGGTLGLGSIGTTLATDNGFAKWEPLAKGTSIKQLTVRIVTGEDDLRGPIPGDLVGGSQVVASVGIQTSQGNQALSWTLNDGEEGWPSGYVAVVRFPLNFNASMLGNTIEVQNIQWFKLEFIPSHTDLFGDNWNMNAIRVLYPKNEALNPPLSVPIDWNQYSQLFYGSGPNGSSPSGPPLHRFKGNPDNEGGPTWQTNNPNWSGLPAVKAY